MKGALDVELHPHSILVLGLDQARFFAGVAWHDAGWLDAVWRGVAWRGVVRCGVAWFIHATSLTTPGSQLGRLA